MAEIPPPNSLLEMDQINPFANNLRPSVPPPVRSFSSVPPAPPLPPPNWVQPARQGQALMQASMNNAAQRAAENTTATQKLLSGSGYVPWQLGSAFAGVASQFPRIIENATKEASDARTRQFNHVQPWQMPSRVGRYQGGN